MPPLFSLSQNKKNRTDKGKSNAPPLMSGDTKISHHILLDCGLSHCRSYEKCKSDICENTRIQSVLYEGYSWEPLHITDVQAQILV